jgi:RNA polymerase sigma-32 factor
MASPPGKSPARGRKGAASKPSRAGKKRPAAERPHHDDEAAEALDDAIEPEIVEQGEWALDEAAAATRHDLVDDDVAEPEEHAAPSPAELLPLAVPDRSTALVPRDALGAYLAQIRQYPVLTREEEHELAVRYFERGDKDAAYTLITSNLKLVVMIAREYQRAFHNLLDLVQEGNVGLLEAVRNFDPYRGVRLPSYAVWWIRAYVIRYVMNNFRLVKVGTTQAQRRLFFNLQKEKARLEAKGFKPTAALIARNLGVKEKEVIEMDQRMGASEVSVDAPVHSESDTPAVELMADTDSETAEDAVADREFYDLMRAKLAEFGATLEGRELEIFRERLMADEPLTLQEFGERWRVSRERVRQIEEALKRRLREFLVDQVRDVPETF